jgi:hypothetical protein
MINFKILSFPWNGIVAKETLFLCALLNLIHNRILEERFTTQKCYTTSSLLIQKKIFPSVQKRRRKKEEENPSPSKM